MRRRFAFASLVLPAIVGGSWLGIGKLHGGAAPFGVEPIYPGLVTGAIGSLRLAVSIQLSAILSGLAGGAPWSGARHDSERLTADS